MCLAKYSYAVLFLAVSKEKTQPLRAKSAIAGSGGPCDSGVSVSKPVCKHLSLILQRRIFIIIIVFALYLLIPLSSPSFSLSQLILKFSSKNKYFVVISYVSANRCNNTAHTHNLSEHLSHSWIHWSDGVTLLYACSFWGPGKRGSSYPRKLYPQEQKQKCERSNPHLQVNLTSIHIP